MNRLLELPTTCHPYQISSSLPFRIDAASIHCNSYALLLRFGKSFFLKFGQADPLTCLILHLARRGQTSTPQKETRKIVERDACFTQANITVSLCAAPNLFCWSCHQSLLTTQCSASSPREWRRPIWRHVMLQNSDRLWFYNILSRAEQWYVLASASQWADWLCCRSGLELDVCLLARLMAHHNYLPQQCSLATQHTRWGDNALLKLLNYRTHTFCKSRLSRWTGLINLFLYSSCVIILWFDNRVTSSRDHF